ncbi:MAG: hypothetical protein E6Q97_31545 [Desulfurellales bacterium]|nr:MAG: hypothetical protein E6Q97_31545 [Desulfurellales bacterium]
MNKSPRAAAIEAVPVPPEFITVPGDAATFNGHLFTDTFANDYRQEIGWTDEHELQILQMLSTAEVVWGALVPREPITVFCQTVTEGDGLERLDDTYTVTSLGDRFLLVTDDGRQRRLAAAELNRRIDWIVKNYGNNPTAESLLNTSPTPTPPPAWLTEAFIEKLLTKPLLPIALRCIVAGEDVDLNDPALLINNLRAKKATINTPLRVLAKQYSKLLGTKNSKGEPHTIATLATEMGVAHDTVASALYYSEVAQDLRDAIDAKRVALRLCVIGRECIAYGFEGKTRTLLSEDQQLAIWGELLRAFAVEAGDGGIPDNAATRRVLRTIKAKALAGTAFADVEKRERAGAKAANEAADRYVAAATAADVDTSALDDMSKPLHRVAAEANEDASERSGKRSKNTTAAPPSAPEPGLRASAPVTIRAALATKAKMLKASFSDFDTLDRDADEEGLALAVADAVASVYEGADPKAVFARFPVLLEACVGAGSAVKKSRKKPTRNLSSPFARTDAAKEIVAVAVDLACDGIMDDSATLLEIEAKLSEAAEQVCDGADAGVIAEIIIESSKLLHSVGDDFATAPRQDTLANHIREGLYPAE